ncbi:MAG TPA: SRPBCC domain-containing protein [Propionibacteriaceae bacterium]|nr:SRPBCC domain-containing protein [Propionibacteriaceae bacterium]
MELTHRFTLPASVEQAWTAFYFAHRIAPCFPGATLTRVAGDEFDGALKIKLGPTPLQYEGTATFLERSPEEQRIVVEAHGKDRRGHGTVAVTVTMTFTGREAETEVEVSSTVEFTGQGASLGQTVIQEVSDRLVQRLVECVSGKFATGLGDLPTAEELATSAAPEHAGTPQRTGRRMSEVANSDQALQPDPEPTVNVAAEQRPAPEVEAEQQPAPEVEAEQQPAPEVQAEQQPAPEVQAEQQPAPEVEAEQQPAPDVQAEQQPTAEVDTEREPDPDIAGEQQPASGTTAEGQPTIDVTSEGDALDAEKLSAPDADNATGASGVADDSGATETYQPALPATADAEDSALATGVLPRVRRLAPPVLGALVALSVISGIVRRIRR